MKLVDLSPEYRNLKVCYFEHTLEKTSNEEALNSFLQEVAFFNDIDISEPLDNPEEKIRDHPVPFLFNMNKVVSWRLFQAAVLSALDSIETGNKKVKTFKSDVYYRMGTGWSVKNIRKRFEVEAGSPILAAWICDIRTEARLLLDQLASIAAKHSLQLRRLDTSNFELNAAQFESLKIDYEVSDEEIKLSGGLELAILQKCAIKDA